VNEPNIETINRFIEVQILLLAPITPFIGEEIWQSIGKKGFIAQADWPIPGEITKNYETFVKETMEDINSVIRLVQIKPKKIMLFIADGWKYELNDILTVQLVKTRDFKEIMSQVMKHENIKKHGQDAVKIIEKSIKTGVRATGRDEEYKALKESTSFLQSEFDCEIEIVKAEDSKEVKAKNALPGKVAILVI
jgi:leucyl-tRNA synthetase